MIRIAVLVAVLAFGALAFDDASLTHDIHLPSILVAAAADTCDGWPSLVEKVLDECPHGPTP